MIDRGRHEILGVLLSAVDYEAVVERVRKAAIDEVALGVSAIAVHGVMTGVLDRGQRYRLNHLDLVVPDGQPLRWALNWLYGTNLADRVYGPDLTLKVCEMAAKNNLPVFFFGSRDEVLDALKRRLLQRVPGLQIAGCQASQFRQLDEAERVVLIDTIRDSGAALVFVGLGCPRQEIWIYEHLEDLPMPMLAVGAAFDFHAGVLRQAPAIWQKRGLEWLYRLLQEPRRLWRRYLLLNPLFSIMIVSQLVGLNLVWAKSERKPVGLIRFG